MDRTLSNGGPSPKNGCTIRYLVGPSKISQLWMELGHLCFGAPFPSIRCIRSNIIPAFSTASSVLEMRRFWSVLTSRVFQEERNGFSKKASIIYSIRVWHGFCCKGSYKFIYIYIYTYIHMFRCDLYYVLSAPIRPSGVNRAQLSWVCRGGRGTFCWQSLSTGNVGKFYILTLILCPLLWGCQELYVYIYICTLSHIYII